MSEQAIAPEDLYALRRSTHTFLTRYAKQFWLTQQTDGEDLPIVPPALASRPDAARMQALGRDEARRISRSNLYCLDVKASDLASSLGAMIRTPAHPAAVRTAGHPDVVATADVGPPAPFGFLRWAHSVGQSHTKAPIIACHWGRIPEGLWVVFWADNHAVVDLIGQKGPVSPWIRRKYLSLTGPLFYHHAILLKPHEPRPDVPSAPPAIDEHGVGVDADTALTYAVLGTWALLTRPGAAKLIRHEPSRAEAMADQRAGITPSTVTYAKGIAEPETLLNSL